MQQREGGGAGTFCVTPEYFSISTFGWSLTVLCILIRAAALLTSQHGAKAANFGAQSTQLSPDFSGRGPPLWGFPPVARPYPNVCVCVARPYPVCVHTGLGLETHFERLLQGENPKWGGGASKVSRTGNDVSQWVGGWACGTWT